MMKRGNNLKRVKNNYLYSIEGSRRLDDSHNEVLDKIKQLETTILDTFYQQSQAFHRLITCIRQESHNVTNALSHGLKVVRTQTAILSTDQADARKEAKEQKAIIEDMDERLATLRSEKLDFRAQAQENYNNLSSQLGELVAYINRGNEKKGEESSSRRPQPPPDDLNRPSGGNANRGGGGGGSGGSGRRDDRKGSSTKKGYGSSGAGGPYKKNAEWWLYGKRASISVVEVFQLLQRSDVGIFSSDSYSAMTVPIQLSQILVLQSECIQQLGSTSAVSIFRSSYSAISDNQT
ncbi:early endosome antigen 1-like [Dorcoceras hygrometricum]|uniref:Early endosome antigen 1-like n=1 Tax=Dorcoceras hygrometricum TaxID=472368 RepID=A0A2Z7D512_9LAMI|nr:early endosome antigen 1-like [Dorcoceras hygrometricum]